MLIPLSYHNKTQYIIPPMKHLLLLAICLGCFSSFSQISIEEFQSGFFNSESDFINNRLASPALVDYVYSDASKKDESYILTGAKKPTKVKKVEYWGARDLEGNIYRFEGSTAMVLVEYGAVKMYAVGIQLERDEKGIVRGFTVLDPNYKFWIENNGLGLKEWAFNLSALPGYFKDEKDLKFKMEPRVSTETLRTMFAFYKIASEYNERKGKIDFTSASAN